MPKCVNCGSSKFELWSLSGRMEDVEKDGSSLVCKDCGRMQPDGVLRELIAGIRKRDSEKASPLSEAQDPEQQQNSGNTA
ncbi:MAG: hypothetical protein V1732_05945 [Patescibacteria group bacterium]